MNARRRPRLFLDHKPPLVAFTVVAVACSLMMVHMARSEAAPGWLRAGLGPIVGQQVVQATTLHPNEVAAPDEAPLTQAAGPLAGLPDGPSAPSSTGAKEHDAPAPPASAGGAQVAGAVVGLVGQVGGSAGDDSADGPDTPDSTDGDEPSHGPGEGRGDGDGVVDGDIGGDLPDVTVPDPNTLPTPRDHSDWRDEWVGDHRNHGRGHGHHGHADRGHGAKAHGARTHGPRAHGSREHGSRAHGSRVHGSRVHGSKAHGHH